MSAFFVVRIDEEALQEAHELRERDAVMFKKFVGFVNQLEQHGVQTPHVKKLVGTKNGWRYDFGRYRALFSLDGDMITIWLVVMEKDTRKDYQRWITYLLQSGKMK
ncbi:MAG: hypothetical protein Q7S16_02205 [bacterium]|nr:hypothetical protein [bacterium]